jgi:hypothetical protein
MKRMIRVWDLAEAGTDVVAIHPRGNGKTTALKQLVAASEQYKRLQAQKNYQQLAENPKPYNIRMRRQRIK